MKTCSKCKELKPLTDFNVSKAMKSGRHSHCKTCSGAASAVWRNENRLKKRAADKLYRDANAQRIRDYKRAWDIANVEAKRGHNHSYKARRRGQTVEGLVWNYYEVIMSFYGRVCLRCGATKNLHLDHVVALFNQGDHAIWNFQVLCASCNSSKGREATDYRGFPRLVDRVDCSDKLSRNAPSQARAHLRLDTLSDSLLDSLVDSWSAGGSEVRNYEMEMA